ncbi:MAG: ABC transporter permease [Brachybacterium sp.]|uniref:ABC transporter permease n=1 Tax=unclassified Brachybacterium TaxID=2623841 RepID=UPI003F8E95EB
MTTLDEPKTTPARTAVHQPTTEWGRRWARFLRNRLSVVSLAFIGLVAVVALASPLLAPYHFATIHRGQELLPSFSDGFVMGTDELGRDVFSRLIYSIRTALFIAVVAEMLSLSIGMVVGLIAGYKGGKYDAVLMAITDVMFAFPGYLFAVLLVAVMGRSTWAIILALTIASWVSQSRLLRAQIMRLKTLEYVEAGRSMGANGWTLVMRYMLPNALGPVLVTVSFGIPANMLAESGLAILGLGVAPPTPSLGAMIVDGYAFVLNSPYLIFWPTIVFVAIMIAFTFVGDGIRDAFDVDET